MLEILYGFIFWILLGILVCSQLDKKEIFFRWIHEKTNIENEIYYWLTIILWPYSAYKIYTYYKNLSDDNKDELK